ncbi:MAG: FAD-dependent oxidoreductase [Ginsengibacter sp.]
MYKKLTENPATGVSVQKLSKVIREGVEEAEITWFCLMPEGSYRILRPGEIPAGYGNGHDVWVPLIETQIFLPWLMNELQQMGVTILQKEISSFDEIANAAMIMNCSALGARQLCDDKEIMPVNGQVGLLSPKEFFAIFLDNELPLYIVPRKDAIIDTCEAEATGTVINSETIDRLLNKAFNVFPELKEQKIIGDWTGLRPYRPLVRVKKTGKIMHNYGHGGSGFTLAWDAQRK